MAPVPVGTTLHLIVPVNSRVMGLRCTLNPLSCVCDLFLFEQMGAGISRVPHSAPVLLTMPVNRVHAMIKRSYWEQLELSILSASG